MEGPLTRYPRAGRWLALIVLSCLLVGVATAEPVATDTAPAPRKYYVEDIKAAMQAHIAARVDAQGVFHLRDDKTGETLALRFIKIHDPVRRIDAHTYFACTDFAVVGAPEKLYDLDFWLRPKGDVLEVYDEKVHKEPRRSLLYGWYKHPRYTFVKDKVVLLY